MDEDKYIEGLIKMLKSDDAGIRLSACKMLCDVSSLTSEAIDALRKASEDLDISVAQAANKALDLHSFSPISKKDSMVQPSYIPSIEAKGYPQKWEHRWEFVLIDEGEYILLVGNRELTGRNVWDHLASLGREGWELVSVAPQIGDTNPNKQEIIESESVALVTVRRRYMTGTTGYFFWYKRPIRTIHCPVCNAALLSDSVFCTKCGSKLVVGK